jgi:hypothetical protein
VETPTKRKRAPKKEKVEDNGGFAGQTAAQFKVEDDDCIDLEEDDLYSFPYPASECRLIIRRLYV